MSTIEQSQVFRGPTATPNIPRWRQLRWNLVAYAVLLALIPVLIVGVFVLQQTRTQTLRQVNQQLESVTTLKLNQISRWLNTSNQAMDIFLSNTATHNLLVNFASNLTDENLTATVNTVLQDGIASQTEAESAFNEFFVYDLNGSIVASSDNAQTGKIVRRQPYFTHSLQGDFIQSPYYDVGNTQLTMLITRRILSYDGAPIGVIAGRLDLTTLGNIMTERVGLGDTGETYLVSIENSYLLTPSRFEGYEQNRAYRTEGINQALSGENGSGLYADYRGISVFGVYRWIPELKAAFLAEVDEAEALALFNQTATFGTITLAVTGLIAALIALYIANRVARPITALTAAASRIAGGDMTQRADIREQNEIGLLANTFNSMADQLQDFVGVLEERVTDRTRDLQIIAEVSAQITTILNVDELLLNVSELTKSRFNLYHAHIYLLDETGQYLVLAAGAGEAGRKMKAQGRRIALNHPHSLVARAGRTRQGTISNDVTQEPDFLPNPLLPDTQSEMAIPMISANRLVGVLDVQANVTNRFTLDDVRTKTTLAEQVAVAIQNARTFNITERQVSDLRAQSQILEALRIGGMNFDAVLENILAIIAETLAADTLVMVEYNADDQTIHGVVGANVEGDIKAFADSMDRLPHVREAIQTGRVVAIDDTHNYPAFPPEYMDEQIGVKSMMVMPLYTNNVPSHFIFINYSAALHTFTSEEIALAQSLSNQISIGLDRGRAEAAVREREQRYQQIMDGVADMILVKGAKSRIVWANKAFREYYGMSIEDMQGMIDAPFAEPDYTQQYILDDAYVFENGVPLEVPEEPVKRHDGEVRFFQTVKTPIFDQNGNTILTVGVSRDITGRKEQDALVHEAREEAEILYQIGTLINKATTPREIAQVIGEHLAPPEVFSVGVSIYENGRYEGAEYIDIAGNWRSDGVDTSGLQITLADFATMSPQDPYAISVIPDVNTDPTMTDNVRAAYQAFGVSGILSIPLMVGDRLMGSISMSTNVPYNFDDRLIRIFRSITEQSANMLDRMFVNVQAQRRAAELETVAKVSAATTTVMDVQDLLQNVVDLTKESFNLYHAHIYLLDDAGQNLVLAAGAGEPGRVMKEQGRSISLNKVNSLVARAGRERKGAISNDVTREPDFLANPLLPDTKSELAVPMLVGNELVGVLDMQSEIINRFTDEDVRVKTALADQVAVAVQNARAFSRIQEAQEAVRANEAQLQSILDNATALIYVKAKGGQYLTVNSSYERVFGIPRQAIIGRTDYDLVPEHVADALRAADEKIWAGETIEVEELVRQPDGMHTYFSVKFPLRDANNEIYAMAGISTDMTERQQAEVERHIVFEAASALNQAQTRDEVFEALLPYARGRNTTTATLMYIDIQADGTPGWAEIVGDWHLEGHGSAPVGTRFYLPEFPFAKLWMSNPNEPTFVEDINTSPLMDDLTRQAMAQTGGQAMVVLPLVSQNRYIGLLSYVWAQPTAFTEQDRRIYTSLMGYATAAIDATRSAEETEAALAQTENLYVASDRIGQATTYDEVLNALVNATAVQHMGRASIALFDHPWTPTNRANSMTLISVWAKNGDTSVSPQGTVYPLERFPITQYLKADEPFVIPDVDTLEGVDENLRALLKRIGMTSLLAVPMVANGEWIASLVAQHTEPGTLTDTQVREINALTAQAATKIQTLRLLEETQRRAAEMETVAKVSAATTTVMDVQDLLQNVVDLTKQSFNLYHAHIYLLDDAGQNLVLAAGAGEAGRIMKEQGRSIPLSKPNSLVARAGHERKGTISNNVMDEADFLPNPLLPSTRSEMAVPMLVGNELIGVLDMQADVVNRFTDEDVRVKTALADQVAVAVQNARAFSRIQEAQNATHELNSRFQSIGETMPGALFQFTFNNGVWATPYMSKGIYDVAGVTAEAVMDDLTRFTERVHPDDIEAYVTSISRVIETLEPWTFEGRLIKPSGEIRWWEAASIPTRLPDGEIVFNGVVFDTTDRKLSEQERETLLAMSTALTDARTAEDVLSAIKPYTSSLGAISHTLYYMDLEDGVPTWLETMAVQTDNEVAEQVGTRYYLPEFPFSKVWMADPNRPTLAGDVAIYAESSPETYHMFHDGGVNALATIPLYLQGRWVGLISISWAQPTQFTQQHHRIITSFMHQAASAVDAIRSTTLTQKRAAELQTVAQVSAAATMLLNADELLHSVVELTKDSFNLYHAHIYLLDETGDHLVLTAGAGEAGEMMKASGHSIAFNHRSSVVARAARTQEGIIVNDVTQAEGFLPNPLLPDTRAEMAIPLIVGTDLIGVLDVQSEVANRFTNDDLAIQSTLADQIAVAVQNARAFQYQQETAERLREVDRLKSQFLANMSHELRTPLNSIIGYAEVLLDGIDGDLSDEAVEDVQAIHGGGKHLLTIINDILDLAKIEAGQMFMDRHEASLTQAVDEVVNTVQILAKNKGIDLNVEYDGDIPTVFGDPIRLKQIVLNLVNNSIKFTEQGSVTINVGLMNDSSGVVVSIRDTGIGMSQDDMNSLFQQFHQVDGSATRRAGGTGLGLVITRHLVHMHEGEIYVESEKGAGSTFWFTLPVFVGQKAQKA